MATHLRLATPQDAPAIVARIHSCYGDSYLDRAALDPDGVAARLASGALYYALALEAGEVVGQVALEQVRGGLYHHCRAVVALEHRGRGLMGELSALLLSEDARARGVELVLGRSVTSHVATQRYNLGAGFLPLGLLLGLYPGTFARGVKAPQQPVTAVLMGLSLAARWPEREVFLPTALEGSLAHLYDALRIPIRQGTPKAGEGRSLDSLIAVRDDDPVLGLAHVRLVRPGDARDHPPLPLHQALRPSRLTWIDLPLGHPATPSAYATLTRRGFVFAAVVPLAGERSEDVLRLQRCDSTLSLDEVHVVPALAPLRERVFELYQATQEALVRA